MPTLLLEYAAGELLRSIEVLGIGVRNEWSDFIRTLKASSISIICSGSCFVFIFMVRVIIICDGRWMEMDSGSEEWRVDMN